MKWHDYLRGECHAIGTFSVTRMLGGGCTWGSLLAAEEEWRDDKKSAACKAIETFLFKANFSEL